MRRRIVSMLGAPSSAGAYAPGQEDAPAALRDAGLVERLCRALRSGRHRNRAVTELNPAHAAADPGALERLCDGIAGALGDPAG